jgi:hypothetical protein
MSPVHAQPDTDWRRRSRRRTLILVSAAVACLAAGLLLTLGDKSPTNGQGHTDLDHVVVLAAWALIGAGYLFAHFRPRRETDAAILARADVLSAKRARMLLLNAGFVGFALTPLSVFEALRLKADASVVDRLFDAVLFLGPAAVTVALITGFTFSRSVGAAVEDELTSANRSDAIRLGFAAALAVGAAGYVAALLRPEWALAAVPLTLGVGVTVAGLRFAQLEQRAADGADEALGG